MLCVIISGVPPFDGEDDQQIIQAVKTMKYDIDSTIFIMFSWRNEDG